MTAPQCTPLSSELFGSALTFKDPERTLEPVADIVKPSFAARNYLCVFSFSGRSFGRALLSERGPHWDLA